jgi:hypothetical protein
MKPSQPTRRDGRAKLSWGNDRTPLHVGICSVDRRADYELEFGHPLFPVRVSFRTRGFDCGGVICFEVFFVPLSILALLIVWTFFVPIPIPIPPFRSAFVSALERSNATLRAIQRDNIAADTEVLARVLPNGLTIKEAEIVLRKEWFYCGPFPGRWAK